MVTVQVTNTGDRPVQVGSHYHFFEVNPALVFDRPASLGCHLDVPAGTAVRFEPGDMHEVQLVAYGGARRVHGFRGKVNGVIEQPPGTHANGGGVGQQQSTSSPGHAEASASEAHAGNPQHRGGVA